mmetsp:Transcript_142540/g.248684  ORF Transcript_142540/g.248684 Transcript_142540/m.248684 type:complete len:90 (-) Transcript_142540:1702-1971(-)
MLWMMGTIFSSLVQARQKQVHEVLTLLWLPLVGTKWGCGREVGSRKVHALREPHKGTVQIPSATYENRSQCTKPPFMQCKYLATPSLSA